MARGIRARSTKNGRGLRIQGVVCGEWAWPRAKVAGLHRSGASAFRVRTSGTEPNGTGTSHGADRMGYVGERAGAGGGAQ